jgi:hypothetical protein
MKSRAKLELVEDQRIDIAALNRADIHERDWSRCHITGDRSRPISLPERVSGRHSQSRDKRRFGSGRRLPERRRSRNAQPFGGSPLMSNITDRTWAIAFSTVATLGSRRACSTSRPFGRVSTIARGG